MQARRTLDISNEIIQSLKQHKNGIDILIREILDEEDSQQDIRILLSHYYSDDRGSITNYRIQEEEIDFDSSGNGSFQIEYDVNYYSGCRDLDSDDEDETMIINFNIDLHSGSITLIGENYPDREPDGL